MDVENGMVCIPIGYFIELVQLDARVSAVIAEIANNDFTRTEDILRILGKKDAVALADKLREKEEERMRKFRSDTSEGVDEAGD